MQGYRRPSSTPMATRLRAAGEDRGESRGGGGGGGGGFHQDRNQMGSPWLIVKSFTPSPAPSTSPRLYGRQGPVPPRELHSAGGVGMQPFDAVGKSGSGGEHGNRQPFQARPSTTGSYTNTSSRLKQKSEILALQKQTGLGRYGSSHHRESDRLQGWQDADRLAEERSLDIIDSELLDEEAEQLILHTGDVRQVEHMVDAWLEQFGEDIAPYFPSVTRKKEFGLRILNVFLERNLVRETKSRPNILVTMQDKCTATSEGELDHTGFEPALAAAVSPKGKTTTPQHPKQQCTSGTQTIVQRDLNEAKLVEQKEELDALKAKMQKMDVTLKKKSGNLTLIELDKAKLEKKICDLQEVVNNCWCCTNPSFQSPRSREAIAEMPETIQRPNTSMGFIPNRSPKLSDTDGLKQRDSPMIRTAGPKMSLQSKFDQQDTPKPPTQLLKQQNANGKKDVLMPMPTTLQLNREKTKKEIKERSFKGVGPPIFDIQLKASQTLNKKLRAELAALRTRVQDMANRLDAENAKSMSSLLQTKERVQRRAENLEITLAAKHDINDRVAKEVEKRMLQVEKDVTILMKKQEDELVYLKGRLHTETKDKRKQLTSARKENEKKEELIILTQDSRIDKMRYQMESKEHSMMQKQMLMEQENRAVIEELEEKCAEVAELESENHNLNQRIVKLEEEIQQEQHKYNLQKIDLDNVKETATKEIDSSRGLKDQHNSLKTDLQEARATAEDYINKFNIATYQIEQLEKTKWFMDKHMTRLKRDIDELKDQHQETTNELIQMRSQCSYLLRDNSNMKIAVNEATKSIATCNNFFYQISDKVTVCENSTDESSATLEELEDTLKNDQIILADQYKSLCKDLESELNRTQGELNRTNEFKKSMNEGIKRASLNHAKMQWQESHMDYKNFEEEFEKEKSKRLLTEAEAMQTQKLMEASEMDADQNLDDILAITRQSNNLRIGLGEECIRIATTNKVGNTILIELGDFYQKVFKNFDNLLFKTDKKLKTFERKEENLRKRVVTYSEYMRSLRVQHNQELHERNKKLRETDKSLQLERMKVQDLGYKLSELNAGMDKKGKETESLKISADAAKSAKERLTKELTLSKINRKRLEAQIQEKNEKVQQANLVSAEYQVQVSVNAKKFEKRVEHFKSWLVHASDSLSQRLTSVKEDFNSMQDDILHELMRTKAFIDYELTNENSVLSKTKIKAWAEGKKT